MPRAAPFNGAFNSGELSPRMGGRVGTEVYASGCYRMENFIPDIAGPAVKRAGTQYIAEVKSSANRTWFVRFELTAGESFILEFGNLYVRFYKNRAPVLSSGVPYEVATPYTTADLVNAAGGFAISYVQSGDILYLASPNHKPRKLSRLGDTNWTMTEYDPTGGPFGSVNATATTVYSSGDTGAVTLTASASIFTADMVGELFYLEQSSISAVLGWETGKAITAGDERRVENRNYYAHTSGTTGTITPTHTIIGSRQVDGDPGVQWEHMDPGFGWARITGYTSGTSVSAAVISRLPQSLVGSGGASTNWAYAAWGSEGYPDSVTFYLDRLVWSRGQTVWMTVAGDYENMQAREGGRQVTESAITLPIPSRRGNSILWMETLETGLVVGTGADEWLVAPASRNDPLGPLNISASPLGAIGSRDVPPLRMFDSIIFGQRSGKKLRGIRYVVGDGAQYGDLNVYADHVSQGFESLAYVAEPFSLIWATDESGDLVGATYYPEQSVIGWFRCPMVGDVECVQSIPAPSGEYDELWLIVRRTINGATKRYVEILRQPLGDDEAQEDAFYVDSGKTYDGSATASITGLSHLEGQTVKVLTDGATHPDRVVSSGAITLQRSSSVVHVGLGYTAKLATMDIEAGAANGTAQGKLKRMWRMGVRLLRTVGGKLGTSETKLDTLQFREASTPMGSAPPLFTGDKVGPAPGGSDRNVRAWFVHEDPMPATVLAFMPHIETEDA